MKMNPENIARQEEIKLSVKKKSAVPPKANATDPARKEKRRRETNGEKVALNSSWKEEEYLKKPEVKISMPELLKSQLVDDWENVTKNHKVSSTA